MTKAPLDGRRAQIISTMEWAKRRKAFCSTQRSHLLRKYSWLVFQPIKVGRTPQLNEEFADEPKKLEFEDLTNRFISHLWVFPHHIQIRLDVDPGFPANLWLLEYDAISIRRIFYSTSSNHNHRMLLNSDNQSRNLAESTVSRWHKDWFLLQKWAFLLIPK